MFSGISTSKVLSVLLIVIFVLASVFVTPVRAGGTVGNGTPGSCTEAAFDAALVGGGAITFNCGPDPVTIYLTSEKALEYPTTIDGGGLIVLLSFNFTRIFNVATLDVGWPVELKNMTLLSGSADNGGAIYISPYETVWLENVFIQGNHATADGGAIYVDNNSTLTLNHVTLYANSSDGEGGAIYNSQGTLNLTDVWVHANTAKGWGGGLNNNQGAATLTDVVFSLNTAGVSGGASDGPGGGGIDNYNAVLTVTHSTFSNNISYSSGGGLRVFGGGTVSLTNVTLSGNQASWYGGGIYADINCTVALNNVTLSGNIAAGPPFAGGGIESQGSVTLKNTILNGSSPLNCGWIPGSTFASLGYNLSSDDSCAAALNQPGDQNNINPLLGALNDNGGYSRTHALLPGSPAIDTGNNATCATTDQRGAPRPQDGDDNGSAICDIGSYEVWADTLYLPLILR